LYTDNQAHDKEQKIRTKSKVTEVKTKQCIHVIIVGFYRAACNADAVLWWDFCPSVCPSVRLSDTRVDCDKMEERSVQIYIPYERTFIL